MSDNSEGKDKKENERQREERERDESKKRKQPGAGIPSEPSDPIDVPVTSTSGEESPARSPGIPSWVAGASPAQFVFLDELANRDLPLHDNMTLVHEIAIDPNFKVGDLPKNPLAAAVKENMYRVYWDLLRDDLAKDPPVYTHAFNLLMEMKQVILSEILLPHHTRLRSHINSILDENQLRNQLEQGELCVKSLGRSICALLIQLCCPARQEDIEKLQTEDDVVNLISGLFAVIDQMKIDFTNYVISVNRNEIEQYSQKLEYEKWCERSGADRDRNTRDWLRLSYEDVNSRPEERIESPSTEEPQAKRPSTSREPTEAQKTLHRTQRIAARGYARLTEQIRPEPFPETLNIDKLRIEALAEKFLQMVITTSSVWITCNLAGKQISEMESFKPELKKKLLLITNEIEEGNLDEMLLNIAEQCVKEVDESREKLGVELPEETSETIRSQVKALSDPNQPVRKIVHSRIARFVEEMLCPKSETTGIRLPTGLSVIQNELYAFMSRFVRICTHNFKTFSSLYSEIVQSFDCASTSTS